MTYEIRKHERGWALYKQGSTKAIRVMPKQQDTISYIKEKSLAKGSPTTIKVHAATGRLTRSISLNPKPKARRSSAKQPKQQKKQRTASHAGFHYHNLYQCCQMKWAIRYLFRINTRFTAQPLINGHAFHEGKATFYETGSKTKALAKAQAEIKDRKFEFEHEEEYQKTLERCPKLLETWIDKFGYLDLKRFKFIGIEKALTMKLPKSGNIVTVRIDAVVQEKAGDKDIYILETKTSSFSIRTTELGVYYGDQATLYTWAVEQKYGVKVFGVIPDIAYWNKQSPNESNISCVRGDIIRRSERRMNQYINGLRQLQSEMAQKIEAVKQGADPYTLFQRNTHYCNAYFKPCEFAEICDNNLTIAQRLPPGFKREKSKIKPKLSDYVEDQCAGLW